MFKAEAIDGPVSRSKRSVGTELFGEKASTMCEQRSRKWLC